VYVGQHTYFSCFKDAQETNLILVWQNW